jgi:electron transfer flavoprotein beta subunit
MEILVCVKHVPNTGQTSVDSHGQLSSAGAQYILNPYDEYAVEQALQIKDKISDAKITVMSLGPAAAEETLRSALAFGADGAILLCDGAFENLDTFHTSLVLAKAVEKFAKADVVICGNKAIDADTWQIPPQLAAHLKWPQILFVKKVDQVSKESIQAKRLTDDGYDVVESSFPVLLSVVKEIGEPRLPSLKGKMNAKKIQIQKWDKAALGLTDAQVIAGKSFVKVLKYSKLEKKRANKVFQGEPAQVVDQFLKAIEEDQVLK